MYKVFQTNLSDEQIDEINQKGWGGTDWDKAYMGLSLIGDEKDVEEKVMAAVEKNLFKHTVSITGIDDLEEVFTIGNGVWDQDKIVWMDHPTSVSVGNVILHEGKLFIVANFGFIEFSNKFSREFETKVTQHMIF